ncbi:hypothetical protein SNE26_24110 [Mucilaginibacter sp. cycad4]|uniref:hypothetical protein n=1 Tax=Mucilaginibacter sp. cycad4 TaxID=3342096 RepID=UPI002AAA6E0C|nr:hypothetical protein [Mucilaginibacter gossypii]WPU99101.1 hypothetical protein SNE26_24110 [Mucilaginibacter gossypii]
MKKIILFILVCCLTISSVFAQRSVVDPWHAAAVAQNAAVRSSAEITHEQYLGKINTNINDLNTNVGSVVLVQTIIYESLSNVNSALKNGLAVKNMALTVSDMTYYINQALTMARSEPYLLTFADKIAAEMRLRAIALVSDVSGYILKEGNNILADYNSRDQLLRKVTQELQILDGLAYGAWKAMYWAKERGIIASLNPYAGFINQDKSIVSQIIQNAKFLRQ